MKRKLINQMCREWRTNIWLILELVIVIIVTEVIFALLYTGYSIHSDPKGMDFHDIYSSYICDLPEDAEGYVAYDSLRTREKDIELLVAHLRNNPYVENVSAASGSSMPYNFNYYGTTLRLPGKDEKDTKYFSVAVRAMTPELIEIFRLQGVDGQTTRQLAEIISRGDVILSDAERAYAEDQENAHFFLNKDVKNDDATMHVAAISYPMRRSDYEPTWSGTCYKLLPLTEASRIVVRVKPGMGYKFKESLTDRDTSAGNIYLSDPESLDDMRTSCQLNVSQTIRNSVVCALFILMVIFLGFLGNFWFRTQQRVSEIAIRKVNGATSANIYIRFFAEGLMLLAVAFVITVPLTYGITKSGILQENGGILEDQMIPAALITLAVMILLIIASIYPPARKATHIDPAYALKEN